ncbi:MAG: Ldh family oxidoreductase, partial [Sphaerochaetaceae bacterium]|nr:Ldh family oxidoreductase [Sphaerochaetaceae bacterium]
MEKKFNYENLISYGKDLLVAAGVPENRALVWASCLVDSDLRGLSSHGLLRLPVYIRRVREGLVNPNASLEKVKDFGAVALLDSHNGIGQFSSTEAMKLAIEKAKTMGIGCVGLGHGTHSGACGHYSEMAIKENMIGFAMFNTNPLIAVYGGSKKVIGNNPFSVAIPALRHDPIVLDMACSVAQGKIQLFAREGKALPSGWAVDENGNPTTDPKEALKGVLLPIAGPKGSGIALVVDIICGLLTNSGIGNEITPLKDNKPQNI